MILLRFVQVITVAALTAGSQQESFKQPSPQTKPVQPVSCPVTRRPAKAFVPPAPYPTESSENTFWLGTEKLWTELPDATTIVGWVPHQPGHEQEAQPLTAKLFWWRVGYDWRAEPHPKLKVTGRRLDGPAPPLVVAPATNAYFSGASSMLVGVYVPTPGCWEITGDYQGDKLSFVIYWVERANQADQ